MIRSVHITNFRCFQDISLENLGTVNVVVGDSAAGKTALLEAVFLASSGNPEAVLRMRGWRGMGQSVAIKRTRAAYDAIWKDLFFRMDQNQVINIALRGNPENHRTLRVYYDPKATATVNPAAAESGTASLPSDSFAITPITFESEDVSGQKELIRPELTATSFSIEGTTRTAPAAFYAASFTATIPPSEAAGQFSELSKQDEDGPVRRAIKALFPDLGPLSIEVSGGTPGLYCIPPGSKEKQKLPIGLVSTGINKLVSILLGIASTPKGVILIDEIENGVYFKTMPKVWESILGFCHKFGVQVFITTHSRECLAAALPTLARHEGAFRLIRAERHGDKRKLRLFAGSEFEAALESDYEVR